MDNEKQAKKTAFLDEEYVIEKDAESKYNPAFLFFYLLGGKATLYLNRVKRYLSKKFSFVFEKIGSVFISLKQMIKKTFRDIKDEVKDIINESKFRIYIMEEQLIEKGASKKTIKQNMLFYKIRERTNVILRLLLKSFNYAGPVLAAFFLIFTVRFFTSLNYSVEVILEGKSLGHVKNEAAYDDAERYMHEKIYFGDSDRVIYTTPTFRLDVVNEEFIKTPQELSNEIVRVISSEVSEAYGLYVDNEFIGATMKKEVVEETIDAVLDQFRSDDENERIQFKKDVRLIEGLYLTETVKAPEEIVELVTSEKETEVTYEVKGGDTLSGIAEKNKIGVGELTALNPGVTSNSIKPGMNLVIRTSKPYLSVVKTGLIKYEDSLPYEIIKTEDTGKTKGYTSVTQQGSEGKAEFLAEVMIEDGVEIERTVLERTIVKEAVDQLVTIGTKPIIQAVPPPTTGGSAGTVSTSGMIWPVQGRGYVSCGYGCYSGHTAIDIQSFYGDNTLAAMSGTVTKAVYSSVGYGNHIQIDHGNGITTLYAHHSKLFVTVGQYVTQGQPIGAQGSTGRSSGVHLHFEIRIYGRPQNPLNHVS